MSQVKSYYKTMVIKTVVINASIDKSTMVGRTLEIPTPTSRSLFTVI